MNSLSKTIPVVLGKGEKYPGVYPLVYQESFRQLTNFQFFDFEHGNDFPIFGKAVDIFGDGSLWAIQTPGHTKGHISYIANGKDGIVLISGDVSITKAGWEKNIPSGDYSENIALNASSFRQLKEFSIKYQIKNIYFGHESDEFPIIYSGEEK